MPTLRSVSRPAELCIVMLLCAATAAHAAPDLTQSPLPMIATRLPATERRLPIASVHSIFHIAKNENRNQVHYAARVDAACRPLGPAPLYAYWRMLERGPHAIEGLLGHEQPAYGVSTPQVVSRNSHGGGSVRIRLRALPQRPLTVQLFRIGDRCAARAIGEIHRKPAVIESIYVDIGFLFSFNYALLRGRRVGDGLIMQEKLRR